VREFETFVFDELDMYREASNASMLRSNFAGSKELYIPEIYWPYCREPVLVMERVSGIPVSDIGTPETRGQPRTPAKRGIRVFTPGVPRQPVSCGHASGHIRLMPVIRKMPASSR
jgi:ubiquinone biosynthesis protein